MEQQSKSSEMDSMTLGCRAFYKAFLEEFEATKPKTNWSKLWKDLKGWTTVMLGSGESRSRGDFGLIGRMAKRFDYQIAAEWRRLDQVWYYELPTPKRRATAPWRNDVVVEHENSPSIENLEYTFDKFDEISAPLKVAIFYPGLKGEKEWLQRCREIVVQQVSSYPGGAHLIIFGFLSEDEKSVFWRAYEIDFKGNIVELP